MAAILEIRGLAAAYGDLQALWDVTFDVPERAVTTLLGSNGAGKTTTLRVVSGTLPATSGEVRVAGERISGRSAHRIVDLGVVQVPEGRHLWPNMTVEDNLLLGAYSQRARSARASTIGEVYTLFPRLAERRRQLAGTLSGGEQQMVAMGRALMSRPRLLLMDEPSMGLAPILVERSFELIKEVHEAGVAVLVVEQNANVSLSIADRGYVLSTGRVVLEGKASELLQNEELRKAYLGR